MPLSLAVSTSEAMTAQGSPPPSEPAKSAFLRLRAIGRIARSTMLESISLRDQQYRPFKPSTEGGVETALTLHKQVWPFRPLFGWPGALTTLLLIALAAFVALIPAISLYRIPASDVLRQ